MASMGVVIDVVERKLDNSGGDGASETFSINGFSRKAGGNPKAALFMMGPATDPEEAANHLRMSIGFTDGTRQFCGAVRSQTGQGATSTYRATADDAVMMAFRTGAASLAGSSSFSAFTTDGVTVTHDDAQPGVQHTAITLFGGSDLQAHCGEVTTSASIDGTVSVTDPGFEPDVLIAFSNDQAANSTPNITAHANLFFGFATNDASLTQGSWNWTDRNAAGTSTLNAIPSSTYLLHDLTVGGAKRTGVLVSSFDATGFTITTKVFAEAHTFYYLALKFNGAARFKMTRTPAPDGSLIEENPSIAEGVTQRLVTSWRPQWAAVIPSLSDAALEEVVSDEEAEAVGFGMIGLSDEACISGSSWDAQPSSVTRSYFSDDFVFLHVGDVNQAETNDAFRGTVANSPFGKISNAGLRVHWNKGVDGLAPHVWYLLVEETVEEHGTSRGGTFSLGALAGKTFSLGAAVGTTIGQLGQSIGRSFSLGAMKGTTQSLGPVAAATSAQSRLTVVADVAKLEMDNTGGNGAEQTFTISNFNKRAGGNPKAAIFVYSMTEAAAEAEGTHRRTSIGLTDGTTQRCAGFVSANNRATTATGRTHINDGVILSVNPLAIAGASSFKEWVTNGVTVTHDDAHPLAYDGAPIFLSLFGGDALKAACGEFVMQTSPGGRTTVTLPFCADVLVFVCPKVTSLPLSSASVTPDGMMSVGFAELRDDGTIQQGCWSIFDNHGGASTSVAGIASEQYAAWTFTSAGGLGAAGSVFSISGFQFQVETAATGDPSQGSAVAYLALKLGRTRHFVGQIAGVDGASTPTTQSITSPGFKPQYAALITSLFDGVQDAASSATLTGCNGMGFIATSDQGSHSCTSDDQSDPSRCLTFFSDVGQYIPDEDKTEEYKASGAFTASGIDMTVTSGLSGVTPYMWWLFIEQMEQDKASYIGRTFTLGPVAGGTLSLGQPRGGSQAQLGPVGGSQTSLGAVKGRTYSLGPAAGSTTSGSRK